MQVSKRLVVRKEIPMDNSRDLISSMDVAMAEYYCKIIITIEGWKFTGRQYLLLQMRLKEIVLSTSTLIRQLTMLRSLILIKIY